VGLSDESIGWSVFNPKDKRFNRELGKEIASARASAGVSVRFVIKDVFWECRSPGWQPVRYERETVIVVGSNDRPPVKIAKAMTKFKKRCERYYK